MTWDTITSEKAMQLTIWMWDALLVVWFLLWFGMKKAKRTETLSERAQHAIPVILAFWLLFENNWDVLNTRLFPETPTLLWVGIALTAIGVGISIWARITLGRNWSARVTLKEGHELVRNGLYRWIRHPIYTGIILGFIGTAIIMGYLRGFIGLSIIWASFYFKARREENFLRQEFGEGFDEHTKSTGMFLPKLI
jgi:protein-S-isoprenylcysteine O-methyltransferase Ste14